MSWQLLSQASTQDSGRSRWFEVSLSRRQSPATIDDLWQYRVVMTGKSIVPGEIDRIRTETTTSPHAIVDFLAMGDPRNRYIPKASRKALHEAADIDRAIGDALDDFDTVVTR